MGLFTIQDSGLIQIYAACFRVYAAYTRVYESYFQVYRAYFRVYASVYESGHRGAFRSSNAHQSIRFRS